MAILSGESLEDETGGIMRAVQGPKWFVYKKHREVNVRILSEQIAYREWCDQLAIINAIRVSNQITHVTPLPEWNECPPKDWWKGK